MFGWRESESVTSAAGEVSALHVKLSQDRSKQKCDVQQSS
jgi:hypothetical protein